MNPPKSQPRLEISEFCSKFNQWAGLLRAKDPRFAEVWEVVSLAIDKSNLLWRLLYAGEEVRRQPCPEHRGCWSGVGPDPGCGCWSYGNITGWLAEGPDNPAAPAPPVVMVTVPQPPSPATPPQPEVEVEVEPTLGAEPPICYKCGQPMTPWLAQPGSWCCDICTLWSASSKPR